MPDYKFECESCGHEFERAMSIEEHENEKVTCPNCQSESVKHVIEPVFVTTSRKT